MVTTTEQFCRGYSELKEQYKQVCFKFVKDEGGKSFRLIDNSKNRLCYLVQKTNNTNDIRCCSSCTV